MSVNGSFEDMRPHIELVRRYNEEKFLKTGKEPTACIRTFGCQQNVSDGEKISGMIAGMGYGFTDSPDDADVVIFNTCAVRENAEDRVFGNIGALKHAKERDSGMIIGICGCMVQQEHIAEKIKRSYPYVDIVFGPSAIWALPKMLSDKISKGGRVFTILDATGGISEDLPIRREGKIKAWLPVMYGCNNFCSYCVVPFVRGRERSRDAESVLAEARGLVVEGYKEITLLGQNVNSYRSDDVDFVKLLRLVNDIPGEFRIKFMTSHPKDCSRELIDAMAECDKVCKYLHLPVQSGSDRILEAMNRRYTAAAYLETINYAKKKIPGIAFTSDVIIGFPGETQEDVRETIKLIREVGYQSLFTFLYSKREGTKAASMEDNVPESEKQERFEELLEIQNAISREKYEEMTGRTLTVLVDGKGKSGEGYLTGRSESNIIVDFPSDEDLTGQFVNIRITKALNWALAGELEDKK